MGSRTARRAWTALLLAVLTMTVVGSPVAARDGARNRTEGLQATGRLASAQRTPLIHLVPNGTVGIKSDLGFFDDSGTPDVGWVVGEVLNRTTARRAFITVTVTFFDENDVAQQPASDVVYLERLAPGMTSPFLVVFEAAPGDVMNLDWTYMVETDAGDVIGAQPVGGLKVVPSPRTTNDGKVQYNGTVHNQSNFTVEAVDANVTLYNADGDVIDVWFEYTLADSIPPGGSSTYSVEFFVPASGLGAIARAGVVSQAWRSGTNDYVTSWSNYFDDIGSTSFRNDIIWLAESGITAGCAPGKYCPNAEVKRDQMASFLSRALKLGGTPADAFSDDNGNTHELQINRLFAAGITSGCAPGKYCPTAPVARDQMASFLSRALGLTGTPANAFSDDNGNTHELQINRLFAAGITTGCGTGIYCPSANVTRGQMAAFLHRAFD